MTSDEDCKSLMPGSGKVPTVVYLYIITTPINVLIIALWVVLVTNHAIHDEKFHFLRSFKYFKSFKYIFYD